VVYRKSVKIGKICKRVVSPELIRQIGLHPYSRLKSRFYIDIVLISAAEHFDSITLSPEITCRILSLPLKYHWLIVKETLEMYRQSVVNRDEAIRSLDRDEEVIKAAEAAAAERSKSGELADVKDYDLDLKLLLDKVKESNPHLFEEAKKIRKVEDVVKFAVDHKDEAQKVAVDRMEIMGAAIHEFMAGYREGKESGIKEATADEQYLSRLVEPLSGPSGAEGKSDERQLHNNSTSEQPTTSKVPIPQVHDHDGTRKDTVSTTPDATKRPSEI
jgi:hypothetical protein